MSVKVDERVKNTGEECKKRVERQRKREAIGRDEKLENIRESGGKKDKNPFFVFFLRAELPVMHKFPQILKKI